MKNPHIPRNVQRLLDDPSRHLSQVFLCEGDEDGTRTLLGFFSVDSGGYSGVCESADSQVCTVIQNNAVEIYIAISQFIDRVSSSTTNGFGTTGMLDPNMFFFWYDTNHRLPLFNGVALKFVRTTDHDAVNLLVFPYYGGSCPCRT